MNTLQERLRDEAGCHYVGREPSTVTMMMRGAADEIDRLLAVNATMREALEIIAGKRQCVDNLMSNVDVANVALRTASRDTGSSRDEGDQG